MDFIAAQKDLQEKLGESVLLIRPLMGDANSISPAAKYIKPESREYHYLASDQYTICREDISENLHILSKEGMFLYLKTTERYVAGDIKGTFLSHEMVRSNSGFWSNNVSSPFYDPEDYKAHLNTFHDLTANGKLTTNSDLYVQTSPIIFFTKEFCLTHSGSIYKF